MLESATVDMGRWFVHGSSARGRRIPANDSPTETLPRRGTMQRFSAAIALSSAVAICACSPKEAAKPDSAKVAQTGAAANAGSYDPATHTATVRAMDFAYAAPDTVQAGWTTFHLVNDGTTFHHLSIERVDSGKTMADVGAALQAQGPPPKWIVEVGGPNVADPKSQTTGAVNLQPGLYVLLCFVDTPDRKPHMAKGMMRPLTVVASTSVSTEPTADLSITLADYAFTTSGALKSGHHTIKVTNKGPQTHEVAVFRLAPGKTLKDIDAAVYTPGAVVPGNAFGGIAGLASGGTAYFDVDLTPGNYVLVCFVPDAKDGKAHLAHGMVKEFKVE